MKEMLRIFILIENNDKTDIQVLGIARLTKHVYYLECSVY